MNFIHGQQRFDSAGPNASTSSSAPAPQINPHLPHSTLESLRFKANQIIDSIQSLQNMIDTGVHYSQMPTWPDVLTKYNILLSQTHSFSVGLAGVTGSGGTGIATTAGTSSATAGGSSGNPANISILERIVLHPKVAMTDAQLEAEVIPLLRNQQTNDVLRAENDTVRRMAEHMATQGSLGVLAPNQTNTSANQPPQPSGIYGYGGGVREKKPVEYADVLRECEEIRGEHDRRVERAVKAVAMLREKFDWKQRVEVEVEEPEELEWDPRAGRADGTKEDGDGGDEMDEDDDSDGDEKGEAGSSPGADGKDANMGDSNSDEDEVQAMVDSEMETQTPNAMAIDVDSLP